MKKKNLIILLILPFIISTFCIMTVNITYNRIDVDISYIEWDYNDMEGFKISPDTYLLEARGVNQRHYKVSADNALVWTVENKNPDDTEPCAEIIESNGKFSLKALREGETIITCSNKKGNISRQMTGVIYKDAAILLYPSIGGSQTNIDSKVYYGQYDSRVGNSASIEMNVMLLPDTIEGELVVSNSPNINFDYNAKKISINGTGDASLTLSTSSGIAKPVSFNFSIVPNGVNVYTYDDLLYCTNRSENGEIAVLRKSFESVDNAYMIDSNGKPAQSGGKPILRKNNIECFGNYNSKTGKFSFADEIYSFKTTYNTNFIEQWNEFAKTNKNYEEITDIIKVGLHVQKDFYGNGYTINLHNLTYPYAKIPMVTDDGTVMIPQLNGDNLFRGPLKFYSLGDPNNMPLVSLYGQDNIGMYVEGDNIVINDVNLRNCDFGDRFANLSTTGTVMETYGDSITVKNSRLSNGKHVLRSFSSMDLTVKNCMLSNAQNFLFVSGSNEYVSVDENAMATFTTLDGSTQKMLVSEFLAEGGQGDAILNDFIMNYTNTSGEKESMKKALMSIQKALGDASKVEGKYKGTTVIEDTYFYRSGIASICAESLFNGAFLQTATPSMITSVFAMAEGSGMSLVPYTATNVSGISYPVKIDVVGDTRFYDYKNVENIELEGLIEENITEIANSVGLGDLGITLDNIFPIKRIISQSTNNNMLNTEGNVNIPVAYYGGGTNLSEVNIKTDMAGQYTSAIDVDLLETYLDIRGSNSDSGLDRLKGVMYKTVTTVSGFEPFKFNYVKNGYLYGETPKVNDLIANAKGE